MPLYQYQCDCGIFDAWRSIAELDNPLCCSQCDRVAQRVFAAPMINLNRGNFSQVEPSKAEPRLVKRSDKTAPPKPQIVAQSRPWMISHAPPRY